MKKEDKKSKKNGKSKKNEKTIEEFFLQEIKLPKINLIYFKSFVFLLSIIFVSSFFGFVAGTFSVFYYPQLTDYFSNSNTWISEFFDNDEKVVPQISREDMIISAIDEASPSVVSIIITKDMPIFEEYYVDPFGDFDVFFDQPFLDVKVPQYRQKGTEEKEIGGGTGFIISEDGMILTNKHVVQDEEADYTILTNDGKKYPARVLARDPIEDLAILKIGKEKIITQNGDFNEQVFPMIKIGDSANLQIGQTTIAIGNALGEFRNTISVGVVSGLGRTITASGGGIIETLEDVIQTDAAINKGNSGGPLLNIKGEVIGINVAMAEQAQSIGFSIPINKAKRDIEQIKTIGKIIYPFLGVRYVLITPEIQKEKELSVGYGALVIKGEKGEVAIVADSSAEKAGLQEGDIILEINSEKITPQNSLSRIIRKYNPEDQISLKILREEKQEIINIVLGEYKE
jgi:serine protease Do